MPSPDTTPNGARAIYGKMTLKYERFLIRLSKKAGWKLATTSPLRILEAATAAYATTLGLQAPRRMPAPGGARAGAGRPRQPKLTRPAQTEEDE